MDPIDFSPLLAHLDAEIATAAERLTHLRALRADLLRAVQPHVGPPIPEPPPAPPPVMAE